MSATIIPLRTGSGGGPRAGASGRVEAGNLLPAADQSEVLRETRHCITETWELRAESRRIKRDYEVRQARIAVLLAGLPDVERA